MKEGIDELDVLLSSKRMTKTIFFDRIKMYLRVSFLQYEGKNIKKTLQIGSVDAYETGKGAFNEIMPIIERKALNADIPLIMIENVQTDQFHRYLERSGWERKMRPGNQHDVCMYKELRPLKEDDVFDSNDYSWMLN